MLWFKFLVISLPPYHPFSPLIYQCDGCLFPSPPLWGLMVELPEFSIHESGLHLELADNSESSLISQSAIIFCPQTPSKQLRKLMIRNNKIITYFQNLRICRFDSHWLLVLLLSEVSGYSP